MSYKINSMCHGENRGKIPTENKAGLMKVVGEGVH